jgi:N-acetylmuramoyl-L-alanine amidase CwlA
MKRAVTLVLSLLIFVLAAPSIMSAAGTTNPKVNDYIISKKLVPAKVEYDHKSIFTKFTYRNGYGEVEGVVAHETANNSSTITGEIAYMVRNHPNAFVHAFADGSRVIEIHTPNYGAWGAGSYANQRFVHVELVRVKTFDQFARSINNYGNYIASVLYDYNLPLVNAEKTGAGTLCGRCL